ncbi:MAG: hypothetical protein KJS64_04385 [Acidobacteria bacterium]|nr:hypothetical protein [Acidobacteriota bacterium]
MTSGRRSRGHLVRTWGVHLMYLTLGVVGNLTAWRLGATNHLVGGTGGDTGQEIWFFQVVNHNFFHGLGFLETNLVNYPTGINLSNITSMPTLGVVFAPVTAIWGPVAAYNVATTLAPSAAASAMYATTGRWMSSRVARFVVGLFFGFSPYVTAQNWGHLFLSTVVLLPLMLSFLHEIFVRQKWPSLVTGMGLGTLIIAQLGLSPELLLDGMVALSIFLVVRFHRTRQWPASRRPYAVRAMRFIAVMMLLPAAIFINNFLNGANSFKGAYRPAHMVSALATDVVAIFLPSSLQHFTLGVGTHVSSLAYYASIGGPHKPAPFESGAYLGVPLLVLLFFVVRRYGRDIRIRALYVTGLAALVLSMGDSLRINGWNTHLPLPFALVRRLPLFESSIAGRWSLYVWFTAAIVIGLGIERVLEQRDRPAGRRLVGVITTIIVVGAALLVPRWPMPAAPQAVPEWFLRDATTVLPRDATVVTYPIAQNGSPLPMMWQAINGMHYRLVAGAAGPQVTAPNPIRDALRLCDAGADPLSDPHIIDAVRTQLRPLPDVYFVVTEYGVQRECATRLFSEIAGSPGVTQRDVTLWPNVAP